MSAAAPLEVTNWHGLGLSYIEPYCGDPFMKRCRRSCVLFRTHSPAQPERGEKAKESSQ